MKTLSLVIILFSIISCKSQEQKNLKNTTMENFDINKYNKNKGVNGYEFVTSDGAITRQIEHENNTYTEEINHKNSPYSEIKIFHKNGILKTKINKFYEVLFGMQIEYDNTGKQLKEVNQDEYFKFTIDDLIKKMKNEYQKDIVLNKKFTYVLRILNPYNPRYEVRINLVDNKYSDTKCYIIDGKNGRTIRENIEKTN